MYVFFTSELQHIHVPLIWLTPTLDNLRASPCCWFTFKLNLSKYALSKYLSIVYGSETCLKEMFEYLSIHLKRA